MGSLAACTVARVIRDASYPTYVEVEYPDGSKSAGAWMCVREHQLDDDGTEVANKLTCVDAKKWTDTMLGKAENGETKL